MPTLPIQMRALSKSCGHAAELGGFAEEGVRLKVKKTFYEVEGAGEDDSQRSSLHERGAQTCSARLSEPTPSLLFLDSPLTVDNETPAPIMPSPSYEAPSGVKEAELPSPPQTDCGLSPTLSSSPSSFDESSPRTVCCKVTVKNTFIEIAADVSPVNDRAAKSCTARLSMSRHDAAQLLATPKAVGNSTTQNGGGTLAEAPVEAITSVVAEAADATVASVAPELKNPGSALHGQFDAEGQHACQPCAWFYKPSGCQNGATCRRCHLCPEGELKLRKKQKIAKLRSQEAAAEAGSTTPPTPEKPREPFRCAARLVHQPVESAMVR